MLLLKMVVEISSSIDEWILFLKETSGVAIQFLKEWMTIGQVRFGKPFQTSLRRLDDKDPLLGLGVSVLKDLWSPNSWSLVLNLCQQHDSHIPTIDSPIVFMKPSRRPPRWSINKPPSNPSRFMPPFRLHAWMTSC